MRTSFYTEQEEREFEHVSNFKHYKELITDSLTHAICTQDSHCDMNPLPGAPSYSLSKLENEAKELVELGPWEYFLVKVYSSHNLCSSHSCRLWRICIRHDLDIMGSEDRH